MDYLPAIFGFLTGGGLSAIASIRYIKKNTKLDYSDRAIKFMDDQNKIITQRFEKLEARVKELEKISCERLECKTRIKSI